MSRPVVSKCRGRWQTIGTPPTSTSSSAGTSVVTTSCGAQDSVTRATICVRSDPTSCLTATDVRHRCSVPSFTTSGPRYWIACVLSAERRSSTTTTPAGRFSPTCVSSGRRRARKRYGARCRVQCARLRRPKKTGTSCSTPCRRPHRYRYTTCFVPCPSYASLSRKRSIRSNWAIASRCRRRCPLTLPPTPAGIATCEAATCSAPK